jgi:signal peptidase II
LVRHYVERYQSISLIGDYLTLTNVENPGAFLGMGSDLSPTLKLMLLLILPVIVLGIVMYKLFTESTLDKWSTIGFASIIGGGIANMLDRFRFGSVTDFLHIDFGGVFQTGIFNAADMFVSAGLILLVTLGFKKKGPDSQEA